VEGIIKIASVPGPSRGFRLGKTSMDL